MFMSKHQYTLKGQTYRGHYIVIRRVVCVDMCWCICHVEGRGSLAAISQALSTSFSFLWSLELTKYTDQQAPWVCLLLPSCSEVAATTNSFLTYVLEDLTPVIVLRQSLYWLKYCHKPTLKVLKLDCDIFGLLVQSYCIVLDLKETIWKLAWCLINIIPALWSRRTVRNSMPKWVTWWVLDQAVFTLNGKVFGNGSIPLQYYFCDLYIQAKLT